jgi:hypothetical protein
MGAAMRNQRNKNRQTGNAVVEFALVSVFLVPLLLGTVNLGLTLGRSIQVNQVCRDAGHMFVRQVDFSKAANQNVIQRLGENIGLNTTTPASSKGVVTLTKILYMGATECLGAGLAVNNCPNYHTPVITHRIVMGKASLRSSDFGTPASSLIGTDGNILPAQYATQASCRATTIGSLLTMNDGDQAYIAESYFEAPEWKFPGSYELTGTYSRAIY